MTGCSKAYKMQAYPLGLVLEHCLAAVFWSQAVVFVTTKGRQISQQLKGHTTNAPHISLAIYEVFLRLPKVVQSFRA